MRCPYCQKEIPDQAKFCTGCGSPLQPEGYSVQNNKKKTWIPFTGAAAVMIIAIAIVIAISAHPANSEDVTQEAGSEETTSTAADEETEEDPYLEAAQNYGEVNQDLIELSESLEESDLTTEEKGELYVDALCELQEEGLIEYSSIVYDKSLGEISYNYADGTMGVILLEGIEEGTSGYGLDTYVTEYNEDGTAAASTDDPVSFDIEGYPYEEEDLSAYACWGLGDGFEDELSVFESSVLNWNKAYLTTQIDYDLTLEELRSDLAGYDLVVIQLHGLEGLGYPILEDGQTWIEYMTSYDEDRVLTQEEIESIEDLQAGRVALMLISGVTYFNYVVYPEFFTYYYGDNGLEDAIVWLGCCEGYLYDDLVDAVYSCGASAVLGCTETVKTLYNLYMQDAFVYSLLYGNTVDESLSFAQSVWGENDSIFWERYWSDDEDYEADIDPSEIRYCEGSADAVLVTLTEEAIASLKGTSADPDDSNSQTNDDDSFVEDSQTDDDDSDNEDSQDEDDAADGSSDIYKAFLSQLQEDAANNTSCSYVLYDITGTGDVYELITKTTDSGADGTYAGSTYHFYYYYEYYEANGYDGPVVEIGTVEVQTSSVLWTIPGMHSDDSELFLFVANTSSDPGEEIWIKGNSSARYPQDLIITTISEYYPALETDSFEEWIYDATVYNYEDAERLSFSDSSDLSVLELLR